MPIIPQSVLDQSLPIEGLVLENRGKVRDSYAIPGHTDKIFVYATDRISVFDIVLPDQIPGKGEVLNAKSVFNTRHVLKGVCQNDLIAAGSEIDEFLPEGLSENPDLQKRGVVVKRLHAPDKEDIVRFILTGTALKSYQKDGTIFGVQMPKGLTNGSLLPEPLYTPTTKAKEGHDEPLDAALVRRENPEQYELIMKLAHTVFDYAQKRHLLFGDTKFELDGLTLIDEKATPDSSRFFDYAIYETMLAKGKLAPSLDKQFVRNWADSVLGISKLDPKNPADIAKVHLHGIPPVIKRMTSQIYNYIFWRYTGFRLEQYQADQMAVSGMKDDPPQRRIEIVLGSRSDLDQAVKGLELLKQAKNVKFSVNILSCHRNPKEVKIFANTLSSNGTCAVIAGAGMAAALPGILKSWLCHFGRPDIPVIGVAFAGKDARADSAAILSIEQVPGKLIEMSAGESAYFGIEGFLSACKSALEDEFYPRNMELKLAEYDIMKAG